MRKKLKPSSRDIQKTLTECKFDPKNHPTLSIVAESDNAEYLRERAIEELIYARKTKNAVHEYRTAIRILTLAIINEESSAVAEE